MSIKSNLAKILPTASLKKARNSISSNIYKGAVEGISSLSDEAGESAFQVMKSQMKNLDVEKGQALTPGNAGKVAKAMGVDYKQNEALLKNSGFASFVKNQAEGIDDVKRYLTSMNDKTDGALKRFKTEEGFETLSKSGDKVFSDKAGSLDKARATASRENLSMFFTGKDLDGGARNNKAIMAGRYALAGAGITGAVDGVQMLTGSRSVLSEDGRTNLPVVPFI